MHRPARTAFAAIVITVVLAGCSSSPRTPEEVHDTKDQAAEYAEFGNRYYREGNYPQALSFFDLAFKENAAVDNRVGLARTYNSIGKVYLATGDIDTAERSFQNAYEIGVRLGNPRILLQSATHLGEASLRRGDMELAMAFFDQAMDERTDDSEQADLAILYHNVGTAHSRLEEYEAAQQFLLDAIAINDERRPSWRCPLTNRLKTRWASPRT